MYRTATAHDVVDASRQRSFLIIADKGAGLPTMYARDTLLFNKRKKKRKSWVTSKQPRGSYKKGPAASEGAGVN